MEKAEIDKEGGPDDEEEEGPCHDDEGHIMTMTLPRVLPP